jgi:OOP family OmpA-OmpF porin
MGAIMEKYYFRAQLFLIVTTLLFSCATPQVQPTRPLFNPSKMEADLYHPKVDNFVVIWDISSSMADEYSGYTKFRIAQDYLSALNQTIPELGYKGALKSFVNVQSVPEKSNILVYGPTTYSTAGFEAALKDVKGPIEDGSVSIASAIDATGEELKATSGTTAIIVLSDGINVDQAVVRAVQNLKDLFGNRACLYPIRIGNDPDGVVNMDKVTAIGACGFPVVVVDRRTNYSMGDLVEDIFLAKIENPVPKPIDSDGDGVPDDRDECPNTPKGANVDERGCWTFEAVLLFDFDSAKIKSEAYSMLNKASAILKKHPEINVEVDGHTCNIGTPAYNQNLSKKRAKAVMEYFVGRGVDAKRLKINGYGLRRPVADNSTKEGRTKNRRVELTIAQ